MRTCTLDGCDRPYRTNGYCNLHALRWKRHGDPMTTLRPTRGTDDIGYRSAHKRVVKAKGHPSEHSCDLCGAQAQEWGYDGTDPDEKHHPNGYAYSLRTWHYQPFCIPCHRRVDAMRRRQTQGREGERLDGPPLGRGLHAITCTPQLTA